MTETERAYIAGFFDGDGSVMALIEPNPELRFKHRIRVVLKFAQNKRHIHVLEELKSIVGSGYLTTTHSDSEYVLKDQRAIEQLLFELYTYVKVKKQVVGLALELIERLKILKTESDFVQAAQLADKISECNLQSKSRRKHTAQSITFPRND
jgi:intein/homing endonuclease